MRAVRAVLIGLAVLVGTFIVGAGPSLSEPLGARGDVNDSMVIVSSNIAAHRDAIGAGVVVAVAPGRIRVLTARHVADRGPVTIWIGGRPWAAEIVRTFANRDLAVVDAVGLDLDRLPLRPAAIAPVAMPGSDVSVWGENETGLRIIHGRLVSAAFIAPDRSGAVGLVRITCDACAHGDSGGGIFDPAGRLIGILTTRYFTSDDHTIAIVGERIEEALYAISDGPFVAAGRVWHPTP